MTREVPMIPVARQVPLILIVDDDPLIRLDLGRTLAAEGYRTIEADSGDQAWSTLYERRPDLIITDLFMAEGHGFDLIRRVRAANAKIPIVAMSGDDRRYRELDRAEVSGADGTLGKPIQRFELLDLVSRLTGGSGRP